jgi:metallo-beta-lactamase class B
MVMMAIAALVRSVRRFYVCSKRCVGWIAVVSASALVAAFATFVWKRIDQTVRSDVAIHNGAAGEHTRATLPRLDGSPHEIISGVYYLGDICPTAVYAIKGPEGVVLIDSGVPFTVPQVMSALKEFGFSARDVRAILITHRHFDHSAGADLIRNMTGAEIYAGAADAGVLERGGQSEDFHSFFPDPGVPLPRFRVDQPIEETVELNVAGIKLTAIASPGHTAGSICYTLRRGDHTIFFGGDTVMTLEGNLGTFGTYYDARYGADAESYLNTLKSLREIPVDVLLPGHPHLDFAASPAIGTIGWRKLIDRGISETETALTRYNRDGRGFLNGHPRPLATALLYLGEFNGDSTYAIRGERGVILVDPPGDDANEELFARLTNLGVSAEEIQWILLTSASSASVTWPRAIADRTGATIRRPSGGTPARDNEITVADGDEFNVAGFDFRACNTPALTRDAVTYSVTIGNYRAAFTGDAVWSPASEPFLTQYAPSLPDSLRTVLETADDEWLLSWIASLGSLAGESVTVWLPRHPVRCQNAFLYDRQWPSILAYQQQIVRAAIGQR